MLDLTSGAGLNLAFDTNVDSSIGIIIGIVIAVLVVAAIIASVIVCKKKSKVMHSGNVMMVQSYPA